LRIFSDSSTLKSS